MTKVHHYTATVSWTGNTGKGTGDYTAYSRNHEILIEGKPVVKGSSDVSFRGDPAGYTPEDLLLSSLSACHMLWYLHLCSAAKVIVNEYFDPAVAVMEENADGSGQFKSVTLHPHVTVADPSMLEKARGLHTDAQRMCFIARSVNFPVRHIPEITCYEKV